MSSIGTYNYNLSKYLCSLLTPILPNQHCTKDSFTFEKETNQVSLSNTFLVSYGVNSLFTNIPLDETIDIATDLIISKNPNFKISK